MVERAQDAGAQSEGQPPAASHRTESPITLSPSRGACPAASTLTSDSQMPRAARSSTSIIAALAIACGGSGSPNPSTKPVPDVHPLAALAATGAIITPTYALKAAPELDWTARLGPTRDVLRGMDDDIAAALEARGLKRGWVMPADLAASYRRNPTYASDPYALAEEPLRSSSFAAGTRLAEPLASQLRTMIALHENASVVLVPVELRFEPANAPLARASLRLALIDPRFSEARWVGEVRSDTTSAEPHVLTAALARRVADLIVSR